MVRRTFLITGARAPVALHLLRLLKGAGHQVHLADSLRAPLAAASRLHDGFHVLPPFRTDPGAAVAVLSERLATLKVDCVIPTCEEALYLGQIWRDHPMPATLFAPGFSRLEEVHNKHRFIALCQSLGLAVPRTQLLQTREDVDAVADKAAGLVFKPVWSRFATQTVLRPGPDRLARIVPRPDFPWVAQDFVAGQELCVYAVAQSGRVVALSAYRGLIRAGLGASVCFGAVQDPAVDRFVAAFVAGTGWTGQISFDLIRRPDGTIMPIECNPRATSGLHFFRDPTEFSRAVLDQGTVAPDVTRPQGVRLALWLYGLPQCLRPGGWRVFRRALVEVEDVMDWPGDTLSLAQQLRPLGEIARLAWRSGVSLQTASTRDLEWNGPGQSAMS